MPGIECAQCTDGEPVVAGKECIYGLVKVQQGIYASLPGFFVVRSLLLKLWVKRDTGLLQRQTVALQTLAASCSCFRAGNDADALIAIGDEEADSFFGRCDVVDQHGVNGAIAYAP